MFQSILVFHICAGFIGLLSGGIAITLRKGSRRHGTVGDVFVVAMLCMSASGAYVGYMRSQPANVLAGFFTFYLVATGWKAGRRRAKETSAFDWTALLLIVPVTVAFLTYGLKASRGPTADKSDAIMYFVFGFVALLALVGDLRLLARGGVTGPARMARHLWRMCIPLFIAANALFLARAAFFPAVLQKMHLLPLPGIATLGTMIFWLVRLRSKKALRKPVAPRTGDLVPLATRSGLG